MEIQLKHLQKIVSKGKIYYYHRVAKVRLTGLPGSTRFMDAYEALQKQVAAKVPPRHKGAVGTFGQLMRDYVTWPEFTELAARTRADYLKVLKYLEPLAPVLLAEFDAPYVMELRDTTYKKRKRRFTNYMLAVLSRMFGLGVPRGLVTVNPVEHVPPIRRSHNARVVNRAWSDEELAVVLAAAPEELKLAIAIAGYAGFRISDVVKLTWTVYNGHAIEVRQKKTDERVWVPVHRDLKAMLDAAKERRTSPFIVVGVKGKPYTVTGLQTRFWKLIAELVKAGKLEPGLSFHGLRHTVGKRLAEAGAAPRTIADMLGQKTTRMGEHYSAEANRKPLVEAAVRASEANEARTKL
jgi:integrase